MPIFVGILVCFMGGCKEKTSKQPTVNQEISIKDTSAKYASGFDIIHFENYTKVVIKNPWNENKESPYAVYYLYKNDSTQLPADNGFRVKIPLQSVVVNTFSYFEFLRLLDELDKVSGVTDAFRIYNPYILSKIEEKKIADLGDPFRPDIERTLALHADAIVLSAYSQQDTFNERLLSSGIPLIYSLEWMENTPLARAEWIKLIAAFFDKEEQAENIFNEIESKYLSIRDEAANISQKHTVMAGDNFQGTWYMPGGKSYNAVLFSDAGFDYFYKDNSESGSIGLDIETVLTKFEKAEYWFGCEADSYIELEKKDKKYLLLQAVKNKKVFNNKKRITPSGGNDYFESATINPHLVLQDFLLAMYPEQFPDAQFTYIKPLE